MNAWSAIYTPSSPNSHDVVIMHNLTLIYPVITIIKTILYEFRMRHKFLSLRIKFLVKCTDLSSEKINFLSSVR
jgi:hypothetical protein